MLTKNSTISNIMHVINIGSVLTYEDSPTYEVSPPSRPQTAAPRLSVSRSRPLTCKSRPSTCKSRPRTAQVRPKTAFARVSKYISYCYVKTTYIKPFLAEPDWFCIANNLDLDPDQMSPEEAM